MQTMKVTNLKHIMDRHSSGALVANNVQFIYGGGVARFLSSYYCTVLYVQNMGSCSRNEKVPEIVRTVFRTERPRAGLQYEGRW